MATKYFIVKLISREPMDPLALTERKEDIMRRHASYWKTLMDEGHVLIFGPVMDPAGVYGLGVIMAESQEQVSEFLKGDPAIEIGRHEVSEILAVVPEE